ncbi:hypothetical protein PCANC_23461 [Puccinia coronata f. sp. avenae]|uniref:Tyr recombinase domain-containing protein n=1 Tax=Puccinia coronata f. sp. avenae TaxID=200324 RepID=A0A2N5UL94_9BASI|nr:hypothetical protein PCANC_27700 [Puccinia coronata f. sp. avenae]PLW38540.1 hypothetical protein PCANC_23461 [Puccinia coronata f. sp. avenae]
MILDITKLKEFTSNSTVKKEMNPRDLHFLKGYKPNTLMGYNAAAWHLLHGEKYPDSVEPTVKVLLRSSAKADAQIPPNKKKGVVHVHHLVHLAELLAVGNPKDEAVFDLAVKGRGIKDAIATITLWDAKTCKPGETQEIRLRALENLLCPVEAVKRRLALCKKHNLPTLFSYAGPGGKNIHLTKDSVVKTLSVAWEEGRFKNLTGHSFRVGGASLRFAMGVEVKEICQIGRWASNCYELYIRPYTKVEEKESTDLLAQLNNLWASEAQPKVTIKVKD